MAKTTRHNDGEAWVSQRSGRGLLQSHSTILSLLIPSILAFPGCAEIQTDGGGSDTPDTVETSIEVKAASDIGQSSNIDIFFFDWNSPCRLDSYQRTLGASSLTASSCTGEKRLVVLAGTHGDRYMWADISNYEDLRERHFKLSEDDPGSPIMSGVAKVEAGSGKGVSLDLRPLLAKVVLRSISCDFSGKSYAGKTLDSAKVYLTNVSSMCCPAPIITDQPTSYLNCGGFTPADTVGVGKLLWSRLPDKIGAGKLTVEKTLYCYQNYPKADEAGTPRTRLVIEGNLDGETCYYPIDVGAKNSPGVSNGVEYIMDVTITRRGTLDPDIPLSAGMMYVSTEIGGWNEKDDTIVIY